MSLAYSFPGPWRAYSNAKRRNAWWTFHNIRIAPGRTAHSWASVTSAEPEGGSILDKFWKHDELSVRNLYTGKLMDQSQLAGNGVWLVPLLSRLCHIRDGSIIFCSDCAFPAQRRAETENCFERTELDH